MTTEILGFIIILGAVIVLLARQHLNKSEDDPEVLEAATGRLRYELEQSADEIINRMTEHVDRLERMLREADYKAELLQQKIDMLQSMVNMDVKMPTTGIDMEEKASAAVYASKDTAQTSNNAEESYDMTPSDEKAWEYIREASMKLEAQYEAQSNTMQSVQQADALQQAVDIQTGNLDGLVSGGGNANAAQTASNAGKAEQLPYIEEGQSLDTEVATKVAKDMLTDGYELEEIAKATGLGIGAVHLIKQLQEKHQ